jgi:hypothetical protein
MAQTLREKLKMRAVFWLARRLPACRELAPLMSQSLERPLSWRESVTLKLHFLTCSLCARYMEQLGFLREAVQLKTKQNEDNGPKLPDEARARLQRALQNKQ